MTEAPAKVSRNVKKRRPKDDVLRTYSVSHFANDGKVEKIAELLPHWQRGLVHMQMLQTRNFIRQGKKPGLIDTKGMPSYLSQRQWKSVVNQTNAALASWSGLLTHALRPRIHALNVDPELRAWVFRANKAAGWFATELEVKVEGVLVKVPAQALELLAPLAREAMRTTNPLPNLAVVRTMQMDGIIAVREDSRSATFTHWLRISTLESGKVVRVPINTHAYVDQADGDLQGHVQVKVFDDRTVRFSIVKAKKKAAELPVGSGNVIALDWGMATMFATDSGELHGRRIYAWLRDRDRELDTLQKELQRNGIKFKDSARWRGLTGRIRGYVKSEIGRVLNTIADQGVREIVVEELDFRGRDFATATMRRLLTRLGRSVVGSKLDLLHEDRGIVSTKVNPAYTSQMCSGCGFAAKENRSSQKHFGCRFCGKTVNADVNAARNILARRSCSESLRYLDKDATLAHVDAEFHARWGVSAAVIRERFQRGRSPATSAVPAGV